MKNTFRRIVLAILWRSVARRVRQDNPYVIGVTGSVGKTSTKDAIAVMLEQTSRPVVKTSGNMATDTGIPLSLLGFPDRAKTKRRWLEVLWRAQFPQFPTFVERPYYVLELSSDMTGDLAFLVRHFPVHVLVYTTGGAVHMEQYGSEEGVIDELASILSQVEPGGYVVINADNQPLSALKPQGKVVLYGLHSRKKMYAKGSIDRGNSGLSLTVQYVSETPKAMDGFKKERLSQVQARVDVVGEQQVYPLVAAAAVGKKEGMTNKQIAAGLMAYQVPAGRGRVIEGARDVTIIDDTANSSPEAVIAGLTMLRAYADSRRVVAILGTMNEMGAHALAAHQEIASAAYQRVDFLVAVGQYNQEMLAAAKKAGMSALSMIGFPNPETLQQQLRQIVQKKDVVYLKASQNGMRLERVVQELMLHPEQASELLVRQGPEWNES